LWWGQEEHLDRPAEVVAMLVILLLNAALGFWQEFKSDRTMERLTRLTEPMVIALRDGRYTRVPASAVVPGDLLVLAAGDRIPADGEWCEGTGLAVNESLLTGESMPLDRVPGEPAWSGTMLVRGRGRLRVTATGANSRLGSLASLLGRVEDPPTRLQVTLTVWGRQIAFAVLCLIAVICALGLVRLPVSEWSSLLVFSLALGVAAVPEGLPLVMTLAMALGMERMAARNAVVRRLQAVEALGSITVIATDKTGTLTLDRQTVVDIDSPRPELLLEAMVLCNDAPWPGPGAPADGAGVMGDPLECALLEHAVSRGMDPAALRRRMVSTSSRPFDAAWKFMRVTTGAGRQQVSWLKGAPEVLMPRCRLTRQQTADWQAMISRRAAEGLRPLAFARGQGETEEGLDWLGVVFLLDPPREEVAAAIAAAAGAGIRTLMMTGDHPATAEAIARRVGIDASRVCEGSWLDTLSDEAVQALLGRCQVYARVLPEQKLRLVRLLQAGGERVAVTGDGVNDAPALKAADVGVAMGQRGSDVSREAADIVLLDDNYATLVAAIEEGRNIHLNIVKFVRLMLAANVAEVLVISLSAMVALLTDALWIAPFTALQILWINVMTDSLPAIAIALDRDQSVLSRPPLAKEAPLLDTLSWRFVWGAGLVSGVVSLALLYGALPAGATDAQAATMAFAFLVVVQLLLVWPARYLGNRPAGNAWLLTAVIVVCLLQMLALLMPGVRDLLTLSVLDVRQWAVLIATVALVSLLVVWGRKKGGG
jgi:Ca2+-transporting ATPase